MFRRQLLLISALLVFSALSVDIICHLKTSFRSTINFQISPTQVLTNTIYEGVNMVVDSKDGAVSKFILTTGTWQPTNLRTFGRFIKKGDVLLNVGSHVGLESMVYGRVAGPTGKLYIFEPYSVSHEIIKKNAYLNGLGNITTFYKVAASNRKDKGKLMINHGNTGGSKVRSGAQAGGEDIQIDMVDNVLPEDVKVDFALIDVEMLDLECLEGMKKVIKRSPNIIIVIEWSGYSLELSQTEYNKRLKDLLTWFEEENINLWKVVRSSYGFYINRPATCEKEKFVKFDSKGFMQFSGSLRGRGDWQLDLVIAAGHIDVNRLE